MTRTEAPLDIRRKNHFIITRQADGWAVTIRRRGQREKTILARTQAEANRLRQRLSRDGLVGWAPSLD